MSIGLGEFYYLLQDLLDKIDLDPDQPISGKKFPKNPAALVKLARKHGAFGQNIHALEMFKSQMKQYRKANAESLQQTRQNMKSLADRLEEASTHVATIMAKQAMELGYSGEQASLKFKSATLKSRIDAAPDFVIVLLHEAEAANDKIQKHAKQLVTELEKIAGQDDFTRDAVLAHPEVKTSAQIAKTLAGLVESFLGTVAHATPRDLTVTVSILGEGGGTQILGHPVHWSVRLAMSLLGLAQKACDAYVSLYKSYETEKFREDVLARLP